MHKIKEKLMEELYEVEEKMKKAGGGKLSAGDLEYIHKLTDSIKNIDKICILEEKGGYSEAVDWMGDGHIYGTSYNDGGNSYARGRGRGARRDSMGRYSRDDGMGGGSYRRGRYSRDGGYSYAGGIEEMMDKASEMLDSAENEQQKQAIRRFMKELERM